MKQPPVYVFYVFSLLFSITIRETVAEEDDWLQKHAVIKTTETQDHDDYGNVLSARTVKTTQINILQTCTETKKRDKAGNLILASRVTETTDTHGGKVQVVESLLPGAIELIRTAVTTVQIIQGGSITTVQNRSTNGTMRIVNRITTVTNPDGTVTTTVEALDKHGKLVPKQTTNQS